MRVQAELQEEEQRPKLKVEGTLTLKERRQETGQYTEEEGQGDQRRASAAHAARPSCPQRTAMGLSFWTGKLICILRN